MERKTKTTHQSEKCIQFAIIRFRNYKQKAKNHENHSLLQSNREKYNKRWKSKDKEKSRKNSKEKLRLADEKTFSEDMLKR